MKKTFLLLLAFSLLTVFNLSAQVPGQDKAVFVVPHSEFMDSINTTLTKYYKKDSPKKKTLLMDFSAVKAPASPDEFKQSWHNPPISQALSGMCWCFSTTSFFESEIYRQTKRKIKLSELYTVYWEYVEKAQRFVQERGNSVFGEGSEANAVMRVWQKYGIVPGEAYTGLLNGQPFHDHGKMYAEMNGFLQSLKTSNTWNENTALETIQSIMNHYIGAPPKSISVNGKQMSPKEYFEKIVNLNPADYIELMSLKEKPYYEFAEYEVEDNWWHSKEYYNVPLDIFTASFKKAVRGGFTAAIGGDTSEPGYEGHAGIAVVPSFDIPSTYIDEDARAFRFANATTQDDHGIHLVGFTEKDGKDWYLIKDSGAGSRNNSHPGYYFYHEDYVKLKMLGILVHKDALKGIDLRLK